MENLLDSLLQISGNTAGYIWWPSTIILLFSVGILMTIQTGGIQFRKLYLGFKLILASKKVEGPGEISPFQALMTALAGTVGNGNIAGVATAIAAGGPGAIFWMWVSALLGMSTKYAEALLGRMYRQNVDGHYYGGPMYYIESLKGKLPGAKFLASWYAIAIMMVGSIGSGNMAQSNSIALALNSEFQIPYSITAIILFLLVGVILLGGIKRIAEVSEKLVPAMIFLYFGSGLFVVFINFSAIPEVFQLIISSAFQPTAAMGGLAGYGIKEALRFGVSRGVLSNESGTGSCAIPSAAAQGEEAVPQALIAMMGTFIDTIIVCSMTGFIIISSGLYGTEGLTSVALTKASFANSFGSELGSIIVSICSIIFGFSTIIAFAYYSEQGFKYLFPKGRIIYLRSIICVTTAMGAVFQGKYLGIVWNTSDIANGLMVLPNLIALLFLTKVVKNETKSYFEKLDSGKLKSLFG